MPKGYSLEYNDFSGGLNTRLPASQIARNEAQVAVNVDLRSGALKSIKDVGTSIGSGYYSLGTAATYFYSGRSLHYAASSYFMDARDYADLSIEIDPAPNFYRQYLDDGDVTYYTNFSAPPSKATPNIPTLTGQVPVVVGVTPPAAPTVTKVSSAGALSGRFKFALTYFTLDDVESNPTFFADISLSGEYISFSIPAPKNTRVIGVRLYRTRADEDVYFLVKEVKNTSGTVTSGLSTDADIDVETQLTWAQGGFPSSGGQYIEDHSPPPTLAVLSNRLHAGNSSGKSGGGIVFGAVGADVRWSILGAPDYWPAVNQFILPGTCEALISVSGTTFAFTATGIFQFIGTSDDVIDVTQTNAAHGVKPGTGHLVTDTPFGMMYQSPEGIALFNGSSSTVISSNKLALSAVEAYTYNSAAFYDNQLFLFHSAGALVADFQDGVGGVRFWNYTSTETVYSGAVASFDAPVVASPFASPLGIVDQVIVTDGGDGYTALPTGSISAPTNGAAASISFSASVSRIIITNAGSGYTTPPEITFAAPAGGTPAKARAFIVNGQVVSIEVIDPGSGYTSVPTATIASGTGGGGSGLAVTVWCTVTGARVTQTGFGFSTTQSVTLVGGTLASGGRAVTALATIRSLDPYQHTSVRVGNNVYIFGGLAYTQASIDGTGNIGLNVLKYGQYFNSSTGAWTAMQAMPVAMHSMMAVTDGTDIYVWTGATSTSDVGASTGSLYKYTVSTNSWSTVTTSGTAPSTGLAGHSAWCVALSGYNYVYVCGGYTSSGVVTSTLYRVPVSPVPPLSPPTSTWETKAMSFGAYMGTAVVGTSVFLFGSRDYSDSSITLATTANGRMVWDKVSLTSLMASTSTVSSQYAQIGVRDSCAATTVTVSGTTYVLLHGGQFVSSSKRELYSSVWVLNSSTNTFTSGVKAIVGLNEIRGHTLVSLADGAVILYGGVVGDSTVLPPSAGSIFYPRAAFDPASTTTLYVCTGTPVLGVVNAYVKPWAQGSTYLPMQWRGREETSPLPGQQHVMTRFRLDYEGQPQLSIFADGAEEPGGGTFFFNPSSSASRTQARQWLPSASGTRPDGRRLSVQFKSPAAAGNDTVVYRFEVDGKTDGS